MTSREMRARARDDRRAARRRRTVANKLAWRTDVAQFMMAVDRAVLAFWPLVAVVVFFLACSEAGVWGRAPDEVRGGLLFAIALGGLFALVRGLRRWRWPSRAEARAKLDEGRRDRPVASFDEEIALGREDAGSGALWEAHQRQVTEKAAGVRAPAPTLTVGGRRDPWAARFFALLLLCGGALLSPSGARIADAFEPFGAEAAAIAPEDAIELWAVPPDYTGLPPIYFEAATERSGVARIPLGSTVYLSAFLAGDGPSLEVTPPLEANPLTQAADGAYSAEIVIDRSRRIELVSRPSETEPAVDLKVEPIPDRAPRVEMVERPQRAGDGRLGLTYAASDDYGVVRAWIEIALDPEGAERFGYPPDAADPEILEVDPPRGGGFVEGGGPPDRSNPTVADIDVSDHRWSGLPVTISLHVEDAIGQTDETEVARFVLPDLMLSEPMAKAVIEQRRAMIWSAAATPRAVRTLYAAAEIPEEYFLGSTIFLLIESALHDLSFGVETERFAEMRQGGLDKLLRAALRLEDQGREHPPGRLERAQRRLREAIERDDITDREITALMDELRGAIQDYIAFLMELARTNPELAEQLAQQFGGGGASGETLGRSQLDQLLDQLEDAARDGERQAAEDMLDALEQLMESLRPGQRGQPSPDGFGQPNPGEGEPGERDVGEEMQDMIEEQQRLAEEGFDEYLRRRREQSEQQNNGQQNDGQQNGGQQNNGQQNDGGQDQAGRPGAGSDERSDRRGGGDGDSTEDLAERQRALRDGLSELRRRLDDELPSDLDDAESTARRRRAEDALERAEEGMENAEERLREGDERGAAREQMEVIENLREGFREFDRRLAEREDRRDRRPGEPGAEEEDFGRDDRRRGDEDRAENRNTDPLGRPRGPESSGPGGLDEYADGDVGSFGPSYQSRELLNELRRRLQEPERPQREREYLDRLLKDLF